MEIVIIAAVGVENRVIGNGLDLPWHIPDDLKRFKALTSGHPIVMGRRTFESLVHQFGGPLKGRLNLVLGSDVEWPEYDNVRVFDELGDAVTAARESGAEQLFIGGGAFVYASFLEEADRMELTLVYGHHEGDVFFPEWEHLVGTRYTETTRDEREGFAFVTYEAR